MSDIKRSSWRWCFRLLVSALGMGGIANFSNPAFAQIKPDTTLGAEGSAVTPNVNVGGQLGNRIDGGAKRGINLFHSFQEFNVGDSQRVYFANPVGIENIFSRITGSNPSSIMGTLGVLGNANLFLLNPNGIIFGANAQLDIRGSFVATTANSFNFPNSKQFSATDPQTPPLLAIAVPIGLQYGTQQAASIVNAGNLAVGQNLTLSGGTVISTGQLSAPTGEVRVEAVSGDVEVRSLTVQTATLSAARNLTLSQSQLNAIGDLNLLAGDTVRVRDSVANPFIAYAGGKLLIQGNQGIDIFALNHPASGLFSGGDMVL